MANQCSADVHESGAWRSRKCTNGGTVRRSVKVMQPGTTSVPRYNEAEFRFEEPVYTPGQWVEVEKWFCGVHDPERAAERDRKKSAEYQAQVDRNARRVREAEDRVARLGVGSVEWKQESFGSRRHYCSGNVVLTPSEVEALIKCLSVVKSAEKADRARDARLDSFVAADAVARAARETGLEAR